MTNDNELRALPELPAGVSEVRVVYADGVRTRLPYDPVYTAEQMHAYARAALAAAPAGGEVDEAMVERAMEAADAVFADAFGSRPAADEIDTRMMHAALIAALHTTTERT